MAVLSGKYICKVCKNTVAWYGRYQVENEFCVVDKIPSEENQAEGFVKPSIIPTIHCVELNCPYCGKHIELIIKDGEQIEIDNPCI